MKIKSIVKKILQRTFLRNSISKLEQQNLRKSFESFCELASKKPRRFDISWDTRFLIYQDATEKHSFDRHYIYHTGWAARKLKELSPDIHIDISSSLYFNSIVSAFIDIRFYDFRPADIQLNNLTCEKADITDLPFPSNSIKSISCMHVVEHIGLGRYGDPLDPDGDLLAFSELKRVLACGGSLLLVVPIGKSQLQFNSQRIYSYSQITHYFSELQLKEFSLVPDIRQEGFLTNATKQIADEQENGCGCFWFAKP